MPGLLDRGVAASPEDAVVDRERDEMLYDALASLAGDDRRIVVLAAQGYRPEEIARMIGCSGAATRTRLCRARGRLRSQLALGGHDRVTLPRLELVERGPRRRRRRGAYHRAVVDDARGKAFIGRAAELGRLAEAYARAAAGESRTVVVAGEAGIGKTRLVDAFAATVAADGRSGHDRRLPSRSGPAGCRTGRSSRRCATCSATSTRARCRRCSVRAGRSSPG